MKNSLFRYILPVLLLGLAACTDELDLEPYQSISEDLALDSDANVKSVLVGAYDNLGDGELFGGNVLRNSELLGADGEVLWVGTFSAPREIFNKQMIAANDQAQETWLEGYETINIVNNVLSALDVVDEEDRAVVEGEARFLRALVYFELVRYYGKPYEAGQANTQPGVPIVLEPTRGIDDKAFVPRNTVAEVYDLVIDDLTEAESLLPEDNGWRASKYAAAGLLSRVYLQMGRCADAAAAADRVISNGAYLLLPNYADVFNRDENSAEDIFAIQVTLQDGDNYMNIFFSIPEFGGRDGDIEIQSKHLNLYPEGDERRDLFFMRGETTYSGKWNNFAGNISLIRLAEMYLTRAEANLCAGTEVGAAPVDDYNEVHTRAGLDPVASVTIEDVQLERRLELAHEGFKIHDMKRQKRSVDAFPYDDDKLVFPIPARELNANANLQQNPGY